MVFDLAAIRAEPAPDLKIWPTETRWLIRPDRRTDGRRCPCGQPSPMPSSARQPLWLVRHRLARETRPPGLICLGGRHKSRDGVAELFILGDEILRSEVKAVLVYSNVIDVSKMVQAARLKR